MSDKIKKGVKGEDMAVEFFKEQGFEIVSRNFRYQHAEIDLIVRKADWLIFVEVKTRSSMAYGPPEAFVTRQKARLIFRAAEEFIYREHWQGHVRFDVVSIKLGFPIEITHFTDALS